VARGADFAPVLPGRRWSFRRDHGAHPDVPHRMVVRHRLAGTADGQPLGFQITFFRVRTGIGEDNPSAFAPRQLLLAHAASPIRRWAACARPARRPCGFGRAGFADRPHAGAWIGDWRLEQRGDRYRAVRGRPSPMTWNSSPTAAYAQRPFAGFSQKAPDPRHASYYYSRPQLAVSGTVTLAGASAA
jgi:predicted secreted hydrolase